MLTSLSTTVWRKLKPAVHTISSMRSRANNMAINIRKFHILNGYKHHKEQDDK